MTRILVEVIVVVLVVSALLYLARQIDTRGGQAHRELSAEQAPPTASWHATHRGNSEDQTEVSVTLRDPVAGQIWDRRTCAVIANQDPHYDKLLYNAMEDAKSRAMLLNSMREP